MKKFWQLLLSMPLAWGTIILWLIAVVLMFVDPQRKFLGLDHHAYTGILFGLAVLGTIGIFVVGSRRETLNDKASK